jgi:WD40 repeat protein
MGPPTCVNNISLNGNTPESVMYGDSNGMVYMILADTSETFQSRDMLYTEHTHDFVCLHDKHKDWVTKVQHVEDVGLVTASQDSKIFIFDVNRDGVMQEITHHAKGVHDFAYCRPYSLFASSSERSIVLWQAQTGRWISELSGHTAIVTNLAVDNEYVATYNSSCSSCALYKYIIDGCSARQLACCK